MLEGLPNNAKNWWMTPLKDDLWFMTLLRNLGALVLERMKVLNESHSIYVDNTKVLGYAIVHS